VKVCDADGCVMPAKWRPKLVARPQLHYEPLPPGEVHIGLCLCDIHRSQATVDSLFSNGARIGVDQRFLKLNMPAPDWERCTLEFEPMDPRVNGAALEVKAP